MTSWWFLLLGSLWLQLPQVFNETPSEVTAFVATTTFKAPIASRQQTHPQPQHDPSIGMNMMIGGGGGGGMGDDECPLPDDEDMSYPHPDLNAEQVTKICMDALQCRPASQSLEICFNYSSDRCRASVGGSLEEFVRYADNPVFGSLVNCEGYDIVSIGPIIPGGTHRGAMQTVLVDIRPPRSQQPQQQQQDHSTSSQGQQQPPRRRRPSSEDRRSGKRGPSAS